MTPEVIRKGILPSELIGADFFRRSDLGYLQGLGLGIDQNRTTQIAKIVRDKFPITFEQARNARHSITARMKILGVRDGYSPLMLAFTRACDLGFIEPKRVPEPRVPLDRDELNVLAFTAMAHTRNVIAQKLGISESKVDVCKASIVNKFEAGTLFPVIAKVRRDMQLQLQRSGNA